MIRKLFYVFSVFLLTPAFAHAGVQFSEVMYDPSGSNTGRQWIEIFNPDSQDIDLAQWTLFQGGVNHKIVSATNTTSTSVSNTSVILPAGSYAVMASDVGKFSLDWPGYTGLIFHSAFTLKVSGEMIALNLNQAGGQSPVPIDQFTIDPSIGGQGDGNSLQKIGGIWISGKPSPGVLNTLTTNTANTGNANSSGSNSGPSVGDTTSSNLSQTSSSVQNQTPIPVGQNNQDDSLADLPTTPQIFCNITSGTAYVTGVPGRFAVSTWGINNQALINPIYLWNFGDGGTATEQNLFHTYHEPGTYVVTLTLASGKFAAFCRLNVTVAEADISISAVQGGSDGFVELLNNSTQDVDLSGFALRSASLGSTETTAAFGQSSSIFYFPQGSLIAPNQPVRFSAETLGFAPDTDSDISINLLYPNGVLLTTYSGSSTEKKETLAQVARSVQANQSIQTTKIIRTTQSSQTKSSPSKSSKKKVDTVPLDSKTSSFSLASTSDYGTTSASVSDLAAAISGATLDDADGDGGMSIWSYGIFALVGILIMCVGGMYWYWKNGRNSQGLSHWKNGSN